MYQIPELKKFPNLNHAFSTRDEGNMSFNWGEEEIVLKNRERFLSKLGISLNSCIALKIQNKDILVTANLNLTGRGMRDYENAVAADGLIVKEKNLYLFLAVADCAPIILFDSKKEIVALIHAGWESTETKIVIKTVRKLITEFDCNVSDICVAIGPAINKESFKFKNPIQKQLPGWKPFLKDFPGGDTAINLIGYNKKQLEDIGVISRNIFISDINTAKDSNFFSHYRDSRRDPENEGRFACVVGLK